MDTLWFEFRSSPRQFLACNHTNIETLIHELLQVLIHVCIIIVRTIINIFVVWGMHPVLTSVNLEIDLGYNLVWT